MRLLLALSLLTGAPALAGAGSTGGSRSWFVSMYRSFWPTAVAREEVADLRRDHAAKQAELEREFEGKRRALRAGVWRGSSAKAHLRQLDAEYASRRKALRRELERRRKAAIRDGDRQALSRADQLNLNLLLSRHRDEVSGLRDDYDFRRMAMLKEHSTLHATPADLNAALADLRREHALMEARLRDDLWMRRSQLKRDGESLSMGEGP